MVKPQPSKLMSWVRFPSPAPISPLKDQFLYFLITHEVAEELVFFIYQKVNEWTRGQQPFFQPC
jgi:hypothetical protein